MPKTSTISRIVTTYVKYCVYTDIYYELYMSYISSRKAFRYDPYLIKRSTKLNRSSEDEGLIQYETFNNTIAVQ